MKQAFAYLTFGLMAILLGPTGLAAQPADFATQSAAQLEEATKIHRDLKDFYIGITATTRTPQAQPYPMLRKKISGMGDVLVRMRRSAQSPLGAANFNSDTESFQVKVRDYETLAKSYGLGQVKVNEYLGEIDSKIDNRRSGLQEMRDRMDKASDKFDPAISQKMGPLMTGIEADWKSIRAKADLNRRNLKGQIYLYSGPGVTRNTMMDQTVTALRNMDAKVEQFEDLWKAGKKDMKADKKAEKKAEKAEKKEKKKNKD